MYSEYINDSLDVDGFYEAYKGMVENEQRYTALFLRKSIPVIKVMMSRYKGDTVGYHLLDDLMSDLYEVILLTSRAKREFDNAGHCFSFFKTVYQRALLKIIGQLNHSRLHSSDALLLIENTKSSSDTMRRVTDRDSIKYIVQQFKESIRFSGLEKNICYYIFDKILKEEEYDLHKLGVKYKVNAYYFDTYTRVLIRSLLYKLSVTKYLKHDI